MILSFDYSNIQLPQYRPFQQVALDEIDKGVQQGIQRQLVCAPTGSGKSIVTLGLAKKYLLEGKKAVIIMDRITLVNQLSATCDKYDLPHSILQGDNPRYLRGCPLTIASAQTLWRKENIDFDLIVQDECHIIHTSTKKMIMNSNALCIGFTATPFTRGLGKIFTRIISPVTADQLTKQGILTPLIIYRGTQIDMNGKPIVNGEFKDKDIEEQGAKIVGDIVKEWKERASNRKTITFAATISQCHTLANMFLEQGVNTAVVSSRTTKAEREVILDEFAKPDSIIRNLVSVEVISRGFDVPDVSCICDCRPLASSLSTYIQEVGRGLRSAHNKNDCLLLDFTGNIDIFGDEFVDVFYNGVHELNMGTKDKAPKKERKKKDKDSKCSKCGFSPMFRKCLGCGHVIPPRVEEIEIVKAEMVKVDLFKKYAPTKDDLWAQCIAYAFTQRTEKKEGMAKSVYKNITGEWPGIDKVFSISLAGNITKEFLGEMQRQRIAVIKSMKGE